MSVQQPGEGRLGFGSGGAAGLRLRFGGAVSLIIALILIALGGILLVVEQRVNSLREQVRDVAEPTGDLIAEVQYLLARQTSALRGYLISNDSTYLARYDSLHAIEQDIHPRLERHVARLSPTIAADVAALTLLSEQWHSRIVIQEIAAVGTAGMALDAPGVLFDQRLYLATLEAAGRAMQAVRQASRDWETEIERVERSGRFVLGFLFFLAGMVAVWTTVLNARIRSLASEAEARRLEAESAMDRTEQVVAQREYLIRGFTHDVKNPLNVAMGYAELLELGYKGELQSQQLQTVGRVRAAIHGAVEIIDNLLHMSRLESDGLRVKREVVDLRALAQDATQHHSMEAKAAGLELTFVDGADAKEATTVTDPDRVRQVLGNLMRNALKFTPSPGQVTVGVDASTADPDRPGGWVRMTVTDTGPGIPFDEQERIFYEFHRVPGSTAPGHGLGLASSQRIARMLGGDVTVSSVPGQGSTFVFWLPLGTGIEEKPTSIT